MKRILTILVMLALAATTMGCAAGPGEYEEPILGDWEGGELGEGYGYGEGYGEIEESIAVAETMDRLTFKGDKSFTGEVRGKPISGTWEKKGDGQYSISYRDPDTNQQMTRDFRYDRNTGQIQFEKGTPYTKVK